MRYTVQLIWVLLLAFVMPETAFGQNTRATPNIVVATGLIVDKAGKPANGVPIFIATTGQEYDSTATDQNGLFLLAFDGGGPVRGTVSVFLVCQKERLCKPHVDFFKSGTVDRYGIRRIRIPLPLRYYEPLADKERIADSEASDRIAAYTAHIIIEHARKKLSVAEARRQIVGNGASILTHVGLEGVGSKERKKRLTSAVDAAFRSVYAEYAFGQDLQRAIPPSKEVIEHFEALRSQVPVSGSVSKENCVIMADSGPMVSTLVPPNVHSEEACREQVRKPLYELDCCKSQCSYSFKGGPYKKIDCAQSAIQDDNLYSCYWMDASKQMSTREASEADCVKYVRTRLDCCQGVCKYSFDKGPWKVLSCR